jgi:hypothetical protein
MVSIARFAVRTLGNSPSTSKSRSSENRVMMRSFSRLVPPLNTISSRWLAAMVRSTSQTQ